MNIDALPLGSNPKALEFPHFPTRLQAVVWRNWELVPVSRLAEVLGAAEQDVLSLADGMGLPVPPEVGPDWLERGYLTIIKGNWHLLPYSQLLTLLGWTPEKLAYTLKEDDFFWIKLGSLKPDAASVVFRPLTSEEARLTAKIKTSIKTHFPNLKRQDKPFGFLDAFEKAEIGQLGSDQLKSRFDLQFIYSYSAVYGDALLNPELDPFPEGMLARYAARGVTGVWLQGILYSLCPDPDAPGLSEGWERRLASLRDLVAKAGKYGIGIYLYLNEPRGMPEAFFAKRPEWKGVYEGSSGNYALCTSRKGVLEYLRNACAHVFKEVPGLAGAFTISMSENITHCHSRNVALKCPLCSKRKVSDVVAEVNSAIAEGMRSAAPSAKMIVWNWGWAQEWEREVIDKLPSDVWLMCVSERGCKFETGGVENEVDDYSISRVGPSERSAGLWAYAKARGLKTIAKVQLNNSWECPATPYIPVPYLVEKHMGKLKAAGVDGLMLSWTLGGYPGGNLELLGCSPEALADAKFGPKAAKLVAEAWRLFSDAFTEFPFHVTVIYNGPHMAGPMNLLHSKPTGYKATMTGYPYDDIDGWRANYPADVLERQFKRLCEGWLRGLEALREAGRHVDASNRAGYEELENVSVAAYCNFRSAYLQIKFVRLRGDASAKSELVAVVKEELELAKTLHGVLMKDSRIGFEASNHYIYTVNDLREKVLNCERILEELA